jgi:hypothetical protein
MQLHPNWVASDPEVLRLEDVLNSGLHDDLHEDEIEDLQMHGKIVGRATARDIAQIYPKSRVAPPIARNAAPVQIPLPDRTVGERQDQLTRKSRVPAALVADEWFNQNYPKLKPEDLADHYRKNVLAMPPRPVSAGEPRGFDNYRNLLKAHVVNSNIPYENDVEPEVFVGQTQPPHPANRLVEEQSDKIPPSLMLTPDVIAMHQMHVGARRRSWLSRVGIFTALTCIALMTGGAMGVYLASSDLTEGLLPDMATTQQGSLEPSLVPPVQLRN